MTTLMLVLSIYSNTAMKILLHESYLTKTKSWDICTVSDVIECKFPEYCNNEKQHSLEMFTGTCMHT